MRLRVVADAAQDQDVVVVVSQRARWQCQQEQADDQRPAHALKRVDQGCHAGIRESCEPSRNTVWQHAAGSPAGPVDRKGGVWGKWGAERLVPGGWSFIK